jgi:2-keto-3-deoxy-L-rhamnonate aldolase RhmA
VTALHDTIATDFQLLLITNSPSTAAHAVASGVDLVFVDLEIKGKRERQAGRTTVISGHTLDDVGKVRAAIPSGTLLVRVNPWDDQTAREVESVIQLGADQIMLPMFRSPAELEALVRLVDGRCAVVGLLETAEAADRAQEIAAIAGVARIHIGLNDLHLAMGRRFMFELLVDGTVAKIASALRRRSVPFGIGGLARVGEGLVPAELLVGEHVALGSSGAILSRTFHRADTPDTVLTEGPALAAEIQKLRSAVRHCRQLTQPELDSMRAEVVARIRRVVETA